MSRDYLVLDFRLNRYTCIGKELVVFYTNEEPPEDWFDATTVSVARGNDISLTDAFITTNYPELVRNSL